MKTSIVIPAHNAQKTLASCLQAVLNQTELLQDCEVIVVDDGSSDRTTVIAACEQVHVLEQSHQGASSARNTGLHQAQGDIIIFLDADCVPEPGWLTAMLTPFTDPAVIGVSGRIVTQQKELLPLFIQLEYDQRFQRLEESENIDFVTSATGAYRRNVLIEMEGFCEDFLGAEDVELSFRLAEQGYLLRYAPHAVVCHWHPTTLLAYARRKRHYAYWRMEVYRRHKDKIIADSRTPQSQKLQLIFLAFTFVTLTLSLFWSPLLWLSALFILAYIITIFPTVRTMWRHDPRIGLRSPLFLTTSAIAGAMGVITALFLSVYSPEQR